MAEIKEVYLFDFGPVTKIQPGDSALMREVAGLHDHLAEKLFTVTEQTNLMMNDARRQYMRELGSKAKFNPDEQIFVSMKTGNCRAILG